MDDVKMRDPRGEMRDDEGTVALIDYPDSLEEIPTLDFAPYLESQAGGLDAVAAKLREISKTVGFFYLKNHGIPQSLIDGAFAENRRFHALPEREKAKLPWSEKRSLKFGYKGYLHQDGYAQANTSLLSNVKPGLYAQFTFVDEDGSSDPTMNLWPENLPGFRENLLAYNRAVGKLGRQFLPLWCRSLNLPLDYLDRYFDAPHLQQALLHYPPQTEIGNRQYGIRPHTDNAMMTFLAQANIPGLAVRMPSGRWRAVDIIPGTLLVNTGNTIVRWTNEEYLSTKHRVINTNTVDRYSIPVFFGPSDNALIEVLPTCQGPGRPPLYEPITYGDLRAWYHGGRK